MPHGMFIVLEGADGSGKGTQFRLLAERLKAVGYDVALFDFPHYDKPSSHFIKSYLNGEYGPASNVSPYTASMFYALDRFEAAPAINEALARGKIVLANRFVGSSMAHQGSKFTNIAERRGFFIWEDSLEFQLLGIPRPTINLFLHVPAEVSYKLIGKKNARSYTTKSHDEHEGDINHLRQTVETYEQLCKLFPKDFKLIECVQKNKLLTIPAINNRIWGVIKPLLPEPSNSPKSTVISLDESYGDSTLAPQSVVLRDVRDLQTNELKSIVINEISYLLLRQVAQYAQLMKTNDGKRPRLRCYKPEKLPPKLMKLFDQTMQTLLANHKKISSKLGQTDMASLVLPLAILSSGRLIAGRQEWASLISRLSILSLKEAEVLNKSLIKNLDKSWPDTFNKRGEDKVTVDFYQKATQLAKDLSKNLSDADQTIWLMSANPRNELDLLADLLYEATDLPKSDIITHLGERSYRQKSELLSSQLKSLAPLLSRVFDQVYYSWDIICDSTAILYLLQSNHLKNLQLQPATPRYGYDVPQEIEDAGLENEYLECFDASLNLYSQLQSDGFENESQYAVLLGHKTRCYMTISLSKIIELTALGSDASQSVRIIIEGMLETIREVHPLIGESLSISIQEPIKRTAQVKKPPSTDSKRRKQNRSQR